MSNPFKTGNGETYVSGESHNGVDCYGGTPDGPFGPVKSDFGFKDNASLPNLPKGVNKYGATEDLGEQGNAAIKHGTGRIAGLS